MSRSTLLILSLLTFLPAMPISAEAIPDVVLAVHGGAASEAKADEPELAKGQREDIEKALKAGYAAMQKAGGTSLDGVEAAVRVLEDSPHFNAGRGSVFTREGQNELDASIMDGKTKKAGAVASVKIVKNPISAARAVMEKTPHVLLGGRGAELFATQQGLEVVDPSYFWTKRRWDEMQKFLKKEAEGKQTSGLSSPSAVGESLRDSKSRLGETRPQREWSTVGAVAVDKEKNVAAATSTGGLTGKMYGRIGDSPIIAAGTYADNEACAVSCTGKGEFFIRLAIANDIAARMKYKSLSVDAAAKEAIEQLSKLGGPGGVIAIDTEGNFADPHNTPGMHRGYITRDGQVKVLLHAEK